MCHFCWHYYDDVVDDDDDDCCSWEVSAWHTSRPKHEQRLKWALDSGAFAAAGNLLPPLPQVLSLGC